MIAGCEWRPPFGILQLIHSACTKPPTKIFRETVKGLGLEDVKAWSEWKDAHPKEEMKFGKIKMISSPILSLYNKQAQAVFVVLRTMLPEARTIPRRSESASNDLRDYCAAH